MKEKLTVKEQECMSPEIEQGAESLNDNYINNYMNRMPNVMLLTESVNALVVEDRDGNVALIKNRGRSTRDIKDINLTDYEKINLVDLPKVNLFERDCEEGEISIVDFVKRFERKSIWLVIS